MKNYLHIPNDIILTWVIYLLQVKSLVLAVDTRQTDFVVSHEVNDVGCIAKLGTGCTVVSHNKNVSLSEIKLFF